MDVGSKVGPKYFNDRLGEILQAFNANGDVQEMSVIDYLAKGKGLAECLNGRVRVFNFSREQDKDYLKENSAGAKALLDQYNWLVTLKDNVQKVAEDFYEKLPQYDPKEEHLSVGRYIVMNKPAATEIARRLSELCSDIQKVYLSRGTAFTYLTDRIEDLRTAYKALPATDTKV